MAKWNTLAVDFPDLRVVNLGVEGSATLPDGQMLAGVIKLVDEKVIPMRPRIVVLYIGENDLWKGVTPEEVHDGIRLITAKLEKALPKTKIVYVALKPSPSRLGIVDQAVATDILLQQDTWSDPHLRFADVFNWMLDDRGEVRLDLFTPDQLHMLASGYEIWTYVIRQALQK